MVQRMHVGHPMSNKYTNVSFNLNWTGQTIWTGKDRDVWKGRKNSFKFCQWNTTAINKWQFRTLQQLKESSLKVQNHKIKVFTLCPKVTALGKVQNEFPPFIYMIQKAENLEIHLQLLEIQQQNITVLLRSVATPDKKTSWQLRPVELRLMNKWD